MNVKDENLNLKTSQNNVFKKNKILNEKTLSKQKRFSNEFSKKNNRKPIFKQSLFHKDISKKNNFLKKKAFVTKPHFVQKCFKPNLLKKEGFHVSKCVCHYCNKIGHFISDCPIKRNAHFEAKMVWVPKTNHEGPKTKKISSTT